MAYDDEIDDEELEDIDGPLLCPYCREDLETMEALEVLAHSRSLCRFPRGGPCPIPATVELAGGPDDGRLVALDAPCNGVIRRGNGAVYRYSGRRSPTGTYLFMYN